MTLVSFVALDGCEKVYPAPCCPHKTMILLLFLHDHGLKDNGDFGERVKMYSERLRVKGAAYGFLAALPLGGRAEGKRS